MEIDKLKQALEIVKLLNGSDTSAPTANGEKRAVVVCTDKRGVFFGYTADPLADPIHLSDARMCIYWTSKIGGVAGLAATGPSDAVKSGSGSRIAAKSDAILRGITAVFPATADAQAAWTNAPIFQGS